MLKLSADIELQAAKGKPRKLEILAYSGNVMSPPGWGPLAIDLAGVEAGDAITILADHRNELGSVVGSGTLTNDGKTLRVSGTLADSPAAEQVVTLARSVKLQASVGLDPTKTERVAKAKTIDLNGRSLSMPAGSTIVRAGRLREVTITPLGADAATSVLVAQRKREMEPTTNENESVADRIEAERQLLAAEHQRIHAIRELTGDRHHDIAARAIAEGWTAEKTKLETLRASYSKGPTIITTNRMTEINKDVLSCAVVMRANGEFFAEQCYKGDDKILSSARQFRNATLLDICKTVLRHNGEYVDETSPHEVLRAAFRPGLRASSGFSTIDVTSLLSDAASKSLKQFYELQPASWRAMADIRSCRDFKLNHVLAPFLQHRLEELPATGEIVHTSVTEEEYTWRANTFARMLAISRTSLINDDLSAFSETSRMLAVMAAQTLSDEFWGLVLANAGPHFSTTNGNQLTAGPSSALSATSLNAAVVMLMKQTDPAGHALDVFPKSLIVSPDLWEVASALLNSVELARNVTTNDKMPMGNPFTRWNLALLIEPRISNTSFAGASTTKWYLASSPSNMGALVGFLNGVTTPTVEAADTDFNTLGMQWRVYHDFGVALADKRSIIMSPGA
jgi:hypothetical protein